MKLKFLLMTLLMIISFGAFATTIQPQLGSASDLVVWLTPVIVWGVTQLTKLIGKLPGFVVVGILVPAISLGVSYFATSSGEDSSWLMTFLYGLGATFLDQLKRQLQEI